MKGTRYIHIAILLTVITCLSGCGDKDKSAFSKTAQDEMIPPPYFTEVNWPEPYSELEEGSLVITGNLQCPAGVFEEMPIAIEMYPVALIDPPLPEFTNPPPTQEELQAILQANQTVQQWMGEARSGSFRRITEGPFIDVEHWSDFTKGNQSYALFSDNFDDDNYFDFETGDFKVDFDETKRLMPAGDVLVLVEGQDQTGLICIAMNIFLVPQMLSPEIMDELDSASIAFADRLTGLGNALGDVLAVSGDGRALDIAMISPFLTLIEETYSDGYSDRIKEVAGEHLRDSGAAAASLIPDSDYRAFYRLEVDYQADDYEHEGYHCWARHYVDLPPETDFLEKQEEAIQYVIDEFNVFEESYVVTERGGGVKELSVQIDKGEDTIAQFTVIGDPANPLSVVGYIGEHTIVPDDYNPYFVELIGVFYSEHYDWPPTGI